MALENGHFRVSAANNSFSNVSKHVFVSVPVGHYYTQVFCVYFIPIVVFFGVIGNCLSIIILSDSAKKVSSHFYLTALAVLDCVTLISIMPSIWLGVVMQGYYHLRHEYTDDNWVRVILAVCSFGRFRVFISYYCRMVSIWTVVIFSVERCIAVTSPLKWGTKLCTVRNAVISISVLVITSAPMHIYTIFGFSEKTTPQGKSVCIPNDLFYIGRLVGNAILSVIPWCIILISNILLIVTLRRRNRQANITSKTDKMQRSITIRLLAVSVAFVIFTMPMMIMGCIHSYHELRDTTDHKEGILADLWLVAFVLFTMNFGFNFVLYCLTGRNFRRAAFELIRCRIHDMASLRARLDRSSSSTKHVGRSDSGTAITLLSNSQQRGSISSVNGKPVEKPRNPLLHQTPSISGSSGGGNSFNSNDQQRPLVQGRNQKKGFRKETVI